MPYFADTSIFAVKSSHSTTALIAVSALALASNAAVFIYQSDESSSLNSIHLRMKSSQTLMHTRKLLKRTSRLLTGLNLIKANPSLKKTHALLFKIIRE